MKIKPKKDSGVLEGDLTPMIDMTFQLIAFFMVLVNFSEAEQDDRIKLPTSELAKPPDGPLETPITLQVTKDGGVLFDGEKIPIEQINSYLTRERQVLESQDKSAGEATIIIRAHAESKTGYVQKLIKACQDTSFERFALRAEQKIPD